jgi:predicted deacylase
VPRSIHIAGVEVAAGERVSIDLPLPHLYTHAAISMPVHIVNGKRAGPRLFVCAALHGDEINGVEIIRRLLRAPALRYLRGTLIAVPVVNVYGFISQSRYLPDRRDLNRSFPGSERGSMAGRLAKLLMEQVVESSSHGIDLHTGALHRDNLPQVRACIEDHPATEQLARAFGTPVIINSNVRDGSLRQAVMELGIPMLLYEAGEALRFNEVAIRAGVKGTIGVMREIGMLKKRIRRRPPPEPFIARSTLWVRAPQSGILRSTTPLGTRVQKGEPLGAVADPFGAREEDVVATVSGLVIGRTNLPLVNEGEALFHIARVEELDSAAEAVEAFQAEFDPNTDAAPPREPPIV